SVARRHQLQPTHSDTSLILGQFFVVDLGVGAREKPSDRGRRVHGLSQAPCQRLDRIRGCKTVAHGDVTFSLKRWRRSSPSSNDEPANGGRTGECQSSGNDANWGLSRGVTRVIHKSERSRPRSWRRCYHRRSRFGSWLDLGRYGYWLKRIDWNGWLGSR